LVDNPLAKAHYLETLAFVAAQNKRPLQTQEYCEQWKQLVNKKPKRKMLILEADLKTLLVLYPQLSSPNKKISPAESVEFDLKQLESHEGYFHQHGYLLNPQQAARLMSVISSNNRSIPKK
jgi:hypothetical protein